MKVIEDDSHSKSDIKLSTLLPIVLALFVCEKIRGVFLVESWVKMKNAEFEFRLLL